MENVNFRLGRRTFLARRTYVSGSGNVENEGRFVCQSPIVFQYIESAFSTKKNLHKKLYASPEKKSGKCVSFLKNKLQIEAMPQELIHSCPELIEYIRQVGMLPLLSMGIAGWSAEEVTDEDCQYTQLPDGGWEWPLWEWKGAILQESGCAYGKFFKGKAAFISREWWPDFCNYRRSLFPYPEEGSIEETILDVLKIEGHQITRKLRTSCGFTGPKMRSRFDAYITRLQMAGYIVTEDFVYPRDRHGREYGWGWSLLTTPEVLFGREACHPDRTPQESRERLLGQLRKVLPQESERTLEALLK